MDNAVGCVPAVELVIARARLKVRQRYGGADERLIQGQYQIGVSVPQGLVILRGFRHERELGDLPGGVPRDVPFEVLVLRVAESDVAIGKRVGSRLVVAITGEQHVAWEANPC
jgi:hypothetical protein